MKTCVLFAGTTEGRRIAELFRDSKDRLEVFVAGSYGADLLPSGKQIRIHEGRKDAAELREELSALSPDLVVDATHPYASVITQNLRALCQELELPCLRVGRPAAGTTKDAVRVSSMKEAVEFLRGTEGNILLTTGTKDLGTVSALPHFAKRCFARVLPSEESVAACREAGLPRNRILALQGPFGTEFNKAVIREYQISWTVTKDSGEAGGFPEKCRAAEETGTGLVIIGRPAEETDACPFAEAVRRLSEIFSIAPQELVLTAMGPGDPELLTREALETVRSADVLIGAKRLLETAFALRPAGEKTPHLMSFAPEEILAFLREHPEYRRAALLYSGDISTYSGAKALRALAKDEFAVTACPGLSSIAYFLGKTGVPQEETCIVSIHGREGNLIPLVRANRYVLALVGNEGDVRACAQALVDFAMPQVKITVGERLSYPEERIYTGLPNEMCTHLTDRLALVLFENAWPERVPQGFGLPDSSFVRGKVPMTKREIRASALSRLGLREDSVVWDVGAGTGSVSVEAALHAPRGEVYAIERRPDAWELLLTNRKKFGCEQLTVVAGEAPECLADLPAPDAVFIGGSGGMLPGILAAVFEKNPDACVVVTAVTYETEGELLRLRSDPEVAKVLDIHFTELLAVREQEAGDYTLRRAESPVLIAEIKRNREET